MLIIHKFLVGIMVVLLSLWFANVIFGMFTIAAEIFKSMVGSGALANRLKDERLKLWIIKDKRFTLFLWVAILMDGVLMILNAIVKGMI